MTDKQKQILAVLSRDGVTTTPTKIGEACGKHYDVASSWACAGLKGLVKAGLVEKVEAGTYCLTGAGWAALREEEQR